MGVVDHEGGVQGLEEDGRDRRVRLDATGVWLSFLVVDNAFDRHQVRSGMFVGARRGVPSALHVASGVMLTGPGRTANLAAGVNLRNDFPWDSKVKPFVVRGAWLMASGHCSTTPRFIFSPVGMDPEAKPE